MTDKPEIAPPPRPKSEEAPPPRDKALVLLKEFLETWMGAPKKQDPDRRKLHEPHAQHRDIQNPGERVFSPLRGTAGHTGPSKTKPLTPEELEALKKALENPHKPAPMALPVAPMPRAVTNKKAPENER
jgi:hypothetical protein